MKKINLLYLLLLLIPEIGNSQQCQINGATATGSNTLASSCVCPPGGGSNCDLIPDISIAKLPLNQTSNYTEYAQVCNPSCSGNDGRLRIGVSTPIIGFGPLETRGTAYYVCGTDTINAGSVGNIPASCPVTGLPPKQLINQRIYRKNGNSMNYWERPAGSMTYHASHGHQHIDDWGIYTLRTNNGDPNPLNWPIIGTGSKLGFCLIDLGNCTSSGGYCTDSAGNTLNSSNISNYGLGGGNYGCNNTVQGITNGFMDTYSQSLDGMWINIPPGVCNGAYWVVVQIDPYNYFLETKENNNVVAVPITLTQQSPGGTATITPNKNPNICISDNIILTANSGVSYLWSNGATTQSITISGAGTYTVTVTSSGCGSAVSSPFTVTTFGPNPPTTTGASVCNSGSATLTASGSGTINWYSSSTGGSSLGTGNSFNTPVVNNTTNYYAEATTISGGQILFCPPANNTFGGGGQYTGGQYLSFNVSGVSTLKSVKIYANVAGSLTVQLQNDSGTVINSLAASVPAGESRVTLNFPLSIGTGYRLTRSGSFSLFRNNSGASYPYNVSNFVSITGSSAGSSFYYFFYDWEITTPIQSCSSFRTPATVTVNPLPTVSFSGLASSYNVTASAATLTGSPGGGTFSGPGISGNTFTPAAAGVGGPYTISYSYTNGNGCSNSSTHQTTVINCTIPVKPGSITSVGGTAKMCPGDSKTYSIAAVSGATSYSWTPPAGGVIASGQGTVSVTINYTSNFIASDSLKVAAINACGTGPYRALKITRNTPATPGTITGQNYNVCNLTAVPYSVTAVAGITYNWSFSVAGATIASGQGTNSVTANYNPSYLTGAIRVSASNACGTSALRTLTVKSTFAAPSSVTGPTTVCANQFGVPYSISPVAGAINYTWTGPNGSRISNGVVTSTTATLVTTSASVTVNYGSTAGNLKVRANNSCGVGAFFTEAISFVCRDGNENLNYSLDLTIYPNPSEGELDVIFHSASASPYIIRLSDVIGKTLIDRTGISIEGENKQHFDLSKITAGIYTIEVINGNHSSIKKLVVK